MEQEFVTETFEYDGGRQVTVFVSPETAEAVVFAGDGHRISKWGRLLLRAGERRTMIVGVHGLSDDMQRLHGFNAKIGTGVPKITITTTFGTIHIRKSSS